MQVRSCKFVVAPSGAGRWNGENASINPRLCANANVSRLPRSASLFAFERGAEKAKLQTWIRSGALASSIAERSIPEGNTTNCKPR
jgi:hypothetical protein